MNLIFIPAQDADPNLYSAATILAEQLGYQPFIMPSEARLMSGKWSDISRYLTYELPHLRQELIKKLDGVSAVYVAVGEDIGTLYAAYYALLESSAPVNVIFHSMRIGGQSKFAERYKKLLQRIFSMIRAHAIVRYNVGDQEHPGATLRNSYNDVPLINGKNIALAR